MDRFVHFQLGFGDLVTTPGINISKMNIETPDEPIDLQLWDLGGQKQFRFFQEDFFKGANIVVLVYDVGWFESFINLDEWIEMVRKHKMAARIYLLANKIDNNNRIISSQDGSEYAERYKMHYYEISALKGNGITDFVADLTSHAIDLAKKKKKQGILIPA